MLVWDLRLWGCSCPVSGVLLPEEEGGSDARAGLLVDRAGDSGVGASPLVGRAGSCDLGCRALWGLGPGPSGGQLQLWAQRGLKVVSLLVGGAVSPTQLVLESVSTVGWVRV